jgi:hypothetical protein
MHRHGNTIAKCEVVEQRYRVKESNLYKVWCKGYSARKQTRYGDVEWPAGECDEFGESMQGDDEELGESDKASRPWIFGRNTF